MGRYDPPRVPCPYDYPDNCNCNTCEGDRRAMGGSSQGSYGRNSGSGRYGSGAFSYQDARFDGYPALKRHRDGKLEFFYGSDVYADGFLEDHVGHGHAIIKNGKLIYKCPPGSSTPSIDLGG